MQIEIVVEEADALAAYASIPISYLITEVLDPETPSPSGSQLPFTLRPLDPPVNKDYDASPGNHPTDWPARFDTSDWGIFAAYRGERRIGGIIIITQSPDVEMLDGRDDLALLWDIRVSPSDQNLGVGSALLAAGETWAREHGARELKVETQNTNVPACQFYASHGFLLRDMNRGAYPAFPNEVQLLWHKRLA
jgi:GNAT superfamily N-acetyltransferase